MPSEMALIEAAIPALQRYAGALRRNRQDVDDLVHDCLVQALDRVHTRRTDASMRAWLFAIMHNLYVSRFRRKQARMEETGLHDAAELPLAVPPRQKDQVQVGDVMTTIQCLSADFRAVLLLIAIEDLFYAEVAEVLGIPIGTVMSRLARARESVRRDCETP